MNWGVASYLFLRLFIVLSSGIIDWYQKIEYKNLHIKLFWISSVSFEIFLSEYHDHDKAQVEEEQWVHN